MLEQIYATRCRHNWPEDAGWTMNRPSGLNECVFLHFLTPVELLLKDKILHLPANSCLFYDIGTPQWFTCKEPMRHNWMHLAGNVHEVLDELKLKTDTIYHPQNPQFITQLIRDIESEFLTQLPLFEDLARAKLQCLLIQLSRSCHQDDDAISTSMRHQFSELRQQVISNLGYDWTVAEMAKRIDFSQSYFQTIYKRLFKVSPIEDLIRARIDTAKFLLSNSSTPVFEIAQELGFSCESHFCRQFKQRTGISASEYRANSTFISSSNRKKKPKIK